MLGLGGGGLLSTVRRPEKDRQRREKGEQEEHCPQARNARPAARAPHLRAVVIARLQPRVAVLGGHLQELEWLFSQS